MRLLHQQWKTPRGGFTHRIRWYQERDGANIRLELCDTDGEHNVFPPNREAAGRTWEHFRDTLSVSKTVEFSSQMGASEVAQAGG